MIQTHFNTQYEPSSYKKISFFQGWYFPHSGDYYRTHKKFKYFEAFRYNISQMFLKTTVSSIFSCVTKSCRIVLLKCKISEDLAATTYFLIFHFPRLFLLFIAHPVKLLFYHFSIVKFTFFQGSQYYCPVLSFDKVFWFTTNRFYCSLVWVSYIFFFC